METEKEFNRKHSMLDFTLFMEDPSEDYYFQKRINSRHYMLAHPVFSHH